jgi:quercetin dioxygenase-like cupin family protein
MCREEKMERMHAGFLGRRQFMCSCCALVGTALTSRFMAAEADEPIVVPVERAPFHVPVFANEYIQMLKVEIPAGRVGAWHKHSIDLAGVVTETHGAVVQVLGQAAAPVDVKPGQVIFAGYTKAPLIHQISNVGSGLYQVLAFEILYPQPGRFSPSARTEVPAYASVIDNDRVRGWRVILEPGQAIPPIAQTAPGVRIVQQSGYLVETLKDQPDQEMRLDVGDFEWQPAGTTRSLKNVGAAPIELIEFELK